MKSRVGRQQIGVAGQARPAPLALRPGCPCHVEEATRYGTLQRVELMDRGGRLIFCSMRLLWDCYKLQPRPGLLVE